MKSLRTISFVLLLTVLSFPSCVQGKEKVVGNGDITTEKINTNSYDGIKVAGSIKVELIEGDEGNISVRTDANLHEYMEVYVKNNKLNISIKDGYTLKTDYGIKLKVPVESISMTSLAGSSDIMGKMTIISDEFKVNLAGSGDIKLMLNVDDINVNIAGSGDVLLKGTCDDLDVDLAGSGDFHGAELKADDVSVDIAGSGDAKVYATDELTAKVVGSGDVHYVGSPRIEKKVLGSGNISPLQ